MLDGVRTRHFRLGRDPPLAAELLDLTLDVARSGTNGPAARRLVEQVAVADVLAAADAAAVRAAPARAALAEWPPEAVPPELRRLTEDDAAEDEQEAKRRGS